MDELKLCESDYRFMTVVWEHAPIESGRLVKLCDSLLGWKKSTTYTVLRKMCERGMIANNDSVVSVLIPKERVQIYESGRVVNHAFGGSLPSFVAAFLGGNTISDEEADEIIRMIDRHKE